VVSLNPIAGAPLRLVGGLAAPARGDMARNVRRAIGIKDEPAPIASDPDEAYLPPGGMARRIHADLPVMLIGGVSALLLQTLHPLAMAGVAEHSSYQEDPLGRLRRTAAFVGTTTYGTVEQAEAAIAQVQRVHRRVKGIAPDGRPYSAADPELVTFIHVAEVASFLASSQRYGTRALTPEECDRYYEEVAPVALALGATWAPRSAAEVESYLLRLRPDLYAGPQARAARDWLLRGVAKRPGERAVYALVVAAAIGVLPGWARRELRLSVAGPLDLLVDTAAVTPLTRGLSTALRWMVAPPAQVASESPPSTTTT
jgi:uncharacterized protein (DUF2236 family)